MPNVPPTNPSILGHIFRVDKGHLPDTQANRTALLDLANDNLARSGSDKYGNNWYANTRQDGTQLWAQTRNGIIIGGGLNVVPVMANPQTGLKKP